MKVLLFLPALAIYLQGVLGARSVVSFNIYHRDTLAYEACTSLISSSATYFSSSDAEGYCNTDLQQALGCMAYCLVHSPNKGVIDYFIKSCAAYNLTHEEFYAAYENATLHLVNATSSSSGGHGGHRKRGHSGNKGGTSSTTLSYSPVYISDSDISITYRTNVARYFNFNYGHFFGLALISYWYLMIFVSGISRFAMFAFPSIIRKMNAPFINHFRKYITLPATGTRAHAHMSSIMCFQWLTPTRYETILVGGWYILALAFNVCDYYHVKGTTKYASWGAELGTYMAYRTGVMVFYIIPTLILFAGRNNFLQWCSGWSYSRFILVHRWTARCAIILVFLHAVGFTLNGLGAGKFYYRNSEPFVRWGWVALVSGVTMWIKSMMFFRKNFYEVFLFFHIVLAAFFVIGGWLHVKSFGYAPWFYCASAVWVFDRVVRIGRLFVFGVRKATIELKSNETLKVTVSRPSYWKPFPGCHAFIHFFGPTYFWQSHPFTMVDSDIHENKITFYLKVKGGMTHSLYKQLSKQPNNTTQMNVAIEGPYGHRNPTDRYNSAIFLSGGNGIPALYYGAREIAKSLRTDQTVKLYWTIRHYRSIEWFYEELMDLKDKPIQVVIYVTQPHLGLTEPIGKDFSSSSEEEEEFKEKNSDAPEETYDYIQLLKNRLSFIEFREGRPQADAIVKSNIDEAAGSIAFTTCAHATFCDDVRKSIADSVTTSKHRVDLFEEIQTW